MRGTLSSPAHLLFTNGFNGTSRHSLSNYDLLWLHPLILAGQRRTCNGLQCTKQLQYFLFASHFTHGTPPSSCAKWCSEQITVPQSSGDPWTNAAPMTSLGRSSWLKPLSHRVSQTFPNLLSDHKSSAIVTSLFHSVLRWCSVSSAWDDWNCSFLWRHLQQWRATCYHKRLKVHDWCLCCNCDVLISNGSNGSPEAYCRGSDLARSGVHLSTKEMGRWEQRWKLRKYGKNDKGENERRVREDGREQVKTKKKRGVIRGRGRKGEWQCAKVLVEDAYISQLSEWPTKSSISLITMAVFWGWTFSTEQCCHLLSKTLDATALLQWFHYTRTHKVMFTWRRLCSQEKNYQNRTKNTKWKILIILPKKE